MHLFGEIMFKASFSHYYILNITYCYVKGNFTKTLIKAIITKCNIFSYFMSPRSIDIEIKSAFVVVKNIYQNLKVSTMKGTQIAHS